MKPRVTFSEDVAVRIYAGLEQGRGLRLICRDPGMPTRPTVMRWLRERPDFRAEVALFRWLGGLDGVGRPSRYDAGIGHGIAERMAYGETLRDICRDPSLPSRSTIHNWMRANPRLGDTLALGRALALESRVLVRLAALGVSPSPDE